MEIRTKCLSIEFQLAFPCKKDKDDGDNTSGTYMDVAECPHFVVRCCIMQIYVMEMLYCVCVCVCTVSKLWFLYWIFQIT